MRLLLFTAIFLQTSLLSAADSPKELWIAFSAKCQNAGVMLAALESMGGADPGPVEELLKDIDDAIAALVASGELIEFDVTLKPFDDWDDVAGTEFAEFSDGLNDQYGAYMAQEMAGMGFRFQMTDPSSGTLKLKVRLPAEELKNFKSLIDSTGLTKDA